MKAKDVMTFGVVSVSEAASLGDAVKAMLTHRISGLPVTGRDGALVGMLSEGDLLLRPELSTELRRPKWLEFLIGPGRLSAEYAHTHGRVVREVMTPEVVNVSEDTEVGEIVRLMQKHKIKRVPVLRNGRLVGIVSRANLLSALGGILERGQITSSGSDSEIRGAILAELEEQKWTPKATIQVAVSGGAVTLSGCILDDREREGLRVLAENVRGVTSVKDEMLTVVPYADAFLPPDA